MSGNLLGPQHSVLLGVFDPIDAAAVEAIRTLAQSGPVHVIVLDGRAAGRPRPLTSALDRQEILLRVRGVTSVTVIDDSAQVDLLVGGSVGSVVWLDPSLAPDPSMTAGSDRRGVLGVGA